MRRRLAQNWWEPFTKSRPGTCACSLNSPALGMATSRIVEKNRDNRALTSSQNGEIVGARTGP